jgi:hypothetical protein
MNIRAYGLSLIFLVAVLACEVSSLVPTVSPTITPDRVATGVAEHKAIAATLTGEAVSRVTQTPLPSKTPEPTITRLLFTPTAANIRAATPTVTPTREGSFVQGNVYSIRVMSVEKTESVLVGTGIPAFAFPGTDNTFLKVRFECFKYNVPIGGDDIRRELQELSVVDSKGNVYKMAEKIGYFRFYEFLEGEWKPGNNFAVHFEIPKSASGLKFRYRDLPLISLEL